MKAIFLALAAFFCYCQSAPIPEEKKPDDFPLPNPNDVERYLEKTKNYEGFVSYLHLLPSDVAAKYATAVANSAIADKLKEVEETKKSAPEVEDHEETVEETDEEANEDKGGEDEQGNNDEDTDPEQAEEATTNEDEAEESDSNNTETSETEPDQKETSEDGEAAVDDEKSPDNDDDDDDDDNDNDTEPETEPEPDEQVDDAEDVGNESENESKNKEDDDDTPTDDDNEAEQDEEEVGEDDDTTNTAKPAEVITATSVTETTTTTTAVPLKLVEPPPVDEIKSDLHEWFSEQLAKKDANLVDVLTRMLYYISGNNLTPDQHTKISELLTGVEPKIFDVLINKETNPDNKAVLQKAVDMIKTKLPPTVQKQENHDDENNVAIFQQNA